MENWIIRIRERPHMFLTDIWIFRRSPTNKTILYTPRGKDIFDEVEYEMSADIPATLTLPTNLMPMLLKEITDGGIKSPPESFVEGKLEATEHHLSDLRQMLKLK